MGSLPANDVIFKDVPQAPDTDKVVPKIESGLDSYDSPSASSLDQDQDLDGETVPEKTSGDVPAPPPKRKGGRKPVSHPSIETAFVD